MGWHRSILLPSPPHSSACAAPPASQGECQQFWDTTQVLSLLATEGYHAGSIREQLIQQAFAKVLYYPSLMVYQVTGVRAVPCSSSNPVTFLSDCTRQCSGDFSCGPS